VSLTFNHRTEDEDVPPPASFHAEVVMRTSPRSIPLDFFALKETPLPYPQPLAKIPHPPPPRVRFVGRPYLPPPSIQFSFRGTQESCCVSKLSSLRETLCRTSPFQNEVRPSPFLCPNPPFGEMTSSSHYGRKLPSFFLLESGFSSPLFASSVGLIVPQVLSAFSSVFFFRMMEVR